MTQAAERSPRRGIGAAGLWGVAAALLGVLAGQLVSLLTNPSSSPFDAVGQTVIDATPAPVKEWAVAVFGTADKVFLLTVIAFGVAVLGWLAGVWERRQAWAGAALLGVLGLGSGIIAMLRPTASATSLIPGIFAAVVAVGLLRWRPAGDLEAEATGVNRRSLILGGAGVAAGGLGLVVTEAALRPGAVGGAKIPVELPVPQSPAPSLPPGLEARVDAITPLRTPIPEFYRIDIALTPPKVDPELWSLVIDGMVRRPYTISFAELMAMPMVERDITLTCVSNPVGGGYCGSTRWLGVMVADIIERAAPEAGAEQMLSMGADGFTASTPLEVIRDGRDAMIAVAMDGQPLTAEHGYPARLLTPGLFGYVGATKWLQQLYISTFAKTPAYWTQRGWSERGPVKTASRIDVPSSAIKAGEQVIAGVAWATHRGVSRVEVRVDQGQWQKATLGEDVGLDYWRQWYLPWHAEPGQYEVTVRAWDGAGKVQDATVRDVVPDGATGYHSRVITVT
ncbi:MAG: molybdopterin-dependent oxidoreductase [Arachnia sp.]